MSSLFKTLKRLLREPGYGKVLLFGAAVTPTNPGRVMVDMAPQGLKLLHTTDTVTEAEWLTQVLRDAGFNMQHVASASTGIFGTSGNSSIYVRPDEFEDATSFLDQFLAGVSTDEVDVKKTIE